MSTEGFSTLDTNWNKIFVCKISTLTFEFTIFTVFVLLVR